MVKILLGTATTDENGKATFEYFAQGLGKIDFMAECNGIESNTVTVNDAPTLYSDNTSHYYSVNSVNNNIGHYRYELWYSTTEDVYVSCIVKQISAGTWNRIDFIVYFFFFLI